MAFSCHSRQTMINLTRLNGDSFLLNPTMIEQVQSHPDTTITLCNGKKILVKNSEKEVEQLIIQFYHKIGVIGTLYEVGETNE